MKSLKESILDTEDNIIKGSESIKNLAQIKEIVKKFEDDLLQFITKDLCYLPGKKGLPTKKRVHIPGLGTCGFRSVNAYTDKYNGKELGKYNKEWSLTIRAKDIYNDTDINPEEFYRYTINFKQQILNHIKQFIKNYDKHNIFKILRAHHEFSVNLNTSTEYYGENVFFEYLLISSPQEVKRKLFQSFLITLRSDRAL